MADRTFTLDWRMRTRKNETVVRAKLGTLDTQLSFRKRVRGPVRVDPSMIVPSAPSSWHELADGIEGIDRMDGSDRMDGIDRIDGIDQLHGAPEANDQDEAALAEPTLRRAIG